MVIHFSSDNGYCYWHFFFLKLFLRSSSAHWMVLWWFDRGNSCGKRGHRTVDSGLRGLRRGFGAGLWRSEKEPR
jgi:hypothetical protein